MRKFINIIVETTNHEDYFECPNCHFEFDKQDGSVCPECDWDIDADDYWSDDDVLLEGPKTAAAAAAALAMASPLAATAAYADDNSATTITAQPSSSQNVSGVSITPSIMKIDDSLGYSRILYDINHKVNTTIKFSPESEGKDNWKMPDKGRGDCEDFALLKRKLLIDAGWPDNDLKIILVYRKVNGSSGPVIEGHAVLLVKSQKMIMDSPTAKDSGGGLSVSNSATAPIVYANYMEKENYKFYCEFKNIEFGSGTGIVSDRCDKSTVVPMHSNKKK